MSKFIVKPNRALEEIMRLNKKHTQYLVFNHEIRSNKLKKERFINSSLPYVATVEKLEAQNSKKPYKVDWRFIE